MQSFESMLVHHWRFVPDDERRLSNQVGQFGISRDVAGRISVKVKRNSEPGVSRPPAGEEE